MKRLDWDDLRLFLAVARAGGLSAATGTTGASPATLGRRMTTLERSLGARLFRRRRDGYDLTDAGRELLARCGAAETAMVSIERWSAAATPRPSVRIAGGAWTSAFLAAHADTLAGGDPRLTIELQSGAGLVDLIRREADLGIRNQRPTTLGLAGRRLGSVAFAIYGSARLIRDRPSAVTDGRWSDCDWVAYAPSQGAETPSAQWLERRLRRPAALRCTDPRTVLDAAAAGAGLCVLPCFIGDPDGRLVRASAPIADLAHDQWLVSHDEDRHNRAIRTAAGRIARLIRDSRALIAGEMDSAAADQRR